MRAYPPARRVAAVDMGTNSTRLLVADVSGCGFEDVERVENVTGLGMGVDRTGRLSSEAIARTLHILSIYRSVIDRTKVETARAVATSATRDAVNGHEFVDAAANVLGFRPEVIGGDEEATLVFAGATRLADNPGDVLVIDIGGGSTEIVSHRKGISIDIGSIRITERCLPSHPATAADLADARREAGRALAYASGASRPTALGTAGTWTTLAGLSLGLRSRDPMEAEGTTLSLDDLENLVAWLGSLSLAEKEALPAMNPRRAPMILGGAVVAETALRILGLEQITVTGYDILDGVCLSLARKADQPRRLDPDSSSCPGHTEPKRPRQAQHP